MNRRFARHTAQNVAMRAAACFALALLSAGAAQAQLRVVAYNIAEDTGGSGIPGTDLITVLQGIGSTHLAGHAQPIDVLALEELYQDPTVTLSSIVTRLNAAYPNANYVYDTTLDHTTDPTLSGNGPSGL